MSEKQRAKHIADAQHEFNTFGGSSLDSAPSSPDGLGTWEGGPVALKGSNRWVAEKSRGSRTTSAKNTPGTDYATKITHRQDQDFNEIHTDANGAFWLYNVKTDAWDILGDSYEIPHYRNAEGLWAYNYRTGAWDVPVTEVELGDEGDTIASAIA